MTVEQLEQEWLTEKQVAKLLGISVRTLNNRIYAGVNHPPFVPGRPKRFHVDEFRKWQKSRMVKEERAS